MFLQKLRVNHFKNHQFSDLTFQKGFNILYGPNGAGKSNILDAIHYLASAKSFLNHIDSELINENADFFRLEAEFVDLEEKIHQLKIILQKGKRKTLEWDGKATKKISEHIGKIPLVFICPQDQHILSGGSDERRKLLDNTLSQISPVYGQNLIEYNQVLEQRNRILKHAIEKNTSVDESLLSIYDEQMQSYSEIIFEHRQRMIIEWESTFQNQYQEISSGSEVIQMIYKSDLSENNCIELMKSSRQKDFILGYTSKGLHRDDILFEFKSQQAKKIGSQGQQKSILIALKLSQYFFLKKHMTEVPILLIDDFHDKLDSERSRKLINLLDNANFEQIFITDTDKDRMRKAFEDVKTDQKYYQTNHSIIKAD